ncbi:MAG: MlaD family protein [Candidatus Babeliales bacterium]
MQVKTETIVGLFIFIALGIFLYATFFLGVFRVGQFKYHSYAVLFTDVAGLEKKADVKIAGVTVGWVDALELHQDGRAVKVHLTIDKRYSIRTDASACVRQESVLGTKYIELIPGNPTQQEVFSGSTLSNQGKSPASLDAILDNLQKTVEQVAAVSEYLKNAFPSFDRDVGAALHTFESTGLQMQHGFKRLESIMEKIDSGKGFVGKLINEDDAYRDLQVTVKGLKKYFNKIDALNIVFDSHSEYMYGPAEHLNFEDAKGYLDVRIHASDDHFYLLQAVMSQKGTIKRSIEEVKWFDERCVEIIPSQYINQPNKSVFLPELVGSVERRKRKLDQVKLGFQLGKLYKDFVFRIGLFENTAGFGMDFDIPFGTDAFRWVTSFEAFDFRGRQRIDDKRPHFKWVNRLFLFRNLYLVAGADDFMSKHNANGFFGGGLRLCDDDFKYFFSFIGLGGLT